MSEKGRKFQVSTVDRRVEALCARALQASLSVDGRTLVLAQTTDATSSELFSAHPPETGHPFPPAKVMIHDGVTDALVAPYLAGNRIYFSHIPKHGNETVMAGDFDPITGTVANASEILPSGILPLFEGQRWLPVVTQDELEVFFAHSTGNDDADVGVHAVDRQRARRERAGAAPRDTSVISA